MDGSSTDSNDEPPSRPQILTDNPLLGRAHTMFFPLV